jgi:hypothetical protein
MCGSGSGSATGIIECLRTGITFAFKIAITNLRFLAYETMLLANAKKYVNKPKSGGGARPLFQEKRPASRKRMRVTESLADDEEPVRIPPPPSGTKRK